MSLTEFHEKIDDILNFKILDKETHLEAISNIIKENDIIKIFENEEDSKKKIFYNLSKRHFDFFNRLDLVLAEKDQPFLVFYNQPNNYSRFTAFKEFEAITNKMVKILGNDNNGNNDFTLNDRQEINEGKWKGRIWNFPKITFCLAMTPDVGSLCYYYLPEFELA